MITGGTEEESLQPVSPEERAARFSQTAAAIALTGSNSKEIAYQLERKLFDNGHASTVLETENTSLIVAIKNAGLICLCVNDSANLADINFDSDTLAIDDIYSALKDQKSSINIRNNSKSGFGLKRLLWTTASAGAPSFS